MLTVDFEKLGVRPGDRVLDLGCGAGRHAYEAARRGAEVVAYDLDAASLKGLSVVSVNGDALNLPFASASFDRVIAAEVLEHIPADTTAIAELVRVLRPGGTIAVTVPRFGPELANWALSDEYHTVPGGHIRIYRESVLASRLRHAGLVVTGRRYVHGLHSPYWLLRCAVGVSNDNHPLVRAYHQVLVWDIMGTPVVSQMTRTTERMLNPFIGKSVVLYGARDVAA